MASSPPSGPDAPGAVYADAATRVGVGTAVNWVGWIVARALALVTLVFLARTLDAADLGAVLASIAAGLLGATLATGGLPDATTRSAVSADGVSGGFGRGDIRSALIRFAATCPAILVLLLLIASSDSGGFDWELVLASVLLAVTQGGTSVLAAVYRARGQAGRFTLVTGLIVAVGRTVIAAFAWATHGDAKLVLWLFVLLNVALIVGTWHSAVRDLPPGKAAGEGETALHLGGAVWALLAHLDVVVVGVVIGAKAAGTYGATLRLAEFSYQFLVAVTVLYLPEVTRFALGDRRSPLVALYRAASRWSALVALLLAGTGFVAAPKLAELILPRDTGISTTLLRILFVGYAVYGALGLGYLTSVALGSFREIRRSSLVALPAIVAATVVFAHVWGLVGAACATASGYVVLSTIWVVYASSTLKATPFDRYYLRGIAASVLTWACAGVAAAATAGQAPLVSVTAIGVVAMVAWLGLVQVTGSLPPAERRGLTRMRVGATRPWRRTPPAARRADEAPVAGPRG
jgi:O-antigen/teichoic acid export membrane protein